MTGTEVVDPDAPRRPQDGREGATAPTGSGRQAQTGFAATGLSLGTEHCGYSITACLSRLQAHVILALG